jgi:hypothetical protein
MGNKQELNKIFSNILGVEVSLQSNEGFDEQMFISIINNWEKAWIMKNELIDKYGILFEGYDTLLFEALEYQTSLLFGKSKAEVIEWYIYEGKDEKGESYSLIDPQTKKSYKLKNAKDLYEFLKIVDNFQSLNFENEDDDNNDDE